MRSQLFSDNYDHFHTEEIHKNINLTKYKHLSKKEKRKKVMKMKNRYIFILYNSFHNNIYFCIYILQ